MMASCGIEGKSGPSHSLQTLRQYHIGDLNAGAPRAYAKYVFVKEIVP